MIEEQIKQAAKEAANKYVKPMRHLLHLGEEESVLINYSDGYIAGANFGREIGMKEAFEWIPVSERLPKEDLRVLVRLKNGKTDVASLVSYPDKFHPEKKRMYWQISTATAYWFDEIDSFRYINQENMP